MPKYFIILVFLLFIYLSVTYVLYGVHKATEFIYNVDLKTYLKDCYLKVK